MYYEEDRKRRKRRKKRRRGSLLGKLIRLIIFLLVLAVLAAGVLYIIPSGIFTTGRELDVSANTTLPGKVVNVLLLGVDVDGNGTKRSDSMMIASVGSGKVKLTSLMRDTEVSIPGWKTAKLNAAYAHGGPLLAIKTVNEAYGLNITRYAEVNYSSFADIVDAAGGVLLNVSADEAGEVNRNLRGQLWMDYQAGRITKYEAERFWNRSKLESRDYVMQRLNGQQALAYSRIRSLDSDYMRASRQRKVLSALIDKVKGAIFDPFTVVPFVKAALESVETNMSSAELISLGLKGLASGGIEQMRIPVDGTFKGGNVNGEWRQHDVDYAANRREFIKFVYE